MKIDFGEKWITSTIADMVRGEVFLYNNVPCMLISEQYIDREKFDPIFYSAVINLQDGTVSLLPNDTEVIPVDAVLTLPR